MDTKLEMRKVYCDTLIEMAQKDERICVVNSDSQKVAATKAFEKAFPERSFNVGIAEADMIGVAAGLSVSGKIPFLASFTPFMTRRCFDQIAISLAYSKLDAVLVGLSPGLEAEINGGTHQGLEDIAIMRSLANTRVVEPFDPVQLKKMLPTLIDFDGPTYMRLDRAFTDLYYPEDYEFHFGKADTLREGRDLTLISSGVMLWQCLEAADALEERGISARVINMHTIKPIDREAIAKAAKETGKIVTVENHTVYGGLGSAVTEVVCEECPVPVKRLGLQNRFGEVGGRPYLRQAFGIDTPDIVSAAVSML